MPYIRYEYDPNDPDSRENARAKAYMQYFLGFVFLWGSVGCAIYFIYSLVSLFNGKVSENIFYSAGLIVLMSVIDFFILFSGWDKESKKEMAGKYFLFFLAGTLDLSGIIAIIVAISSLCHKRSGATLLICSMLAVIFVTIAAVLIYRKIEGYGPIAIKLFAAKEIASESFNADNRKNNIPTTTNEDVSGHIFCHKCGKCLPYDSVFCSSCGAKLR